MVWRVLIAVGLVVAMAGCSVVQLGGSSICDASEQERVACLQFANFAAIDGLEVSELRMEGFGNTAVRFRLQGPADVIDRALAAAAFTEVAAPGTDATQLGSEVDLGGLDEVRSAKDRWIDAQEQPVYRQILRGRRHAVPGVEVLYVLGFTI